LENSHGRARSSNTTPRRKEGSHAKTLREISCQDAKVKRLKTDNYCVIYLACLEEDRIAKEVVDAAIKLHKQFGPKVAKRRILKGDS
jgi:hypothetical protein